MHLARLVTTALAVGAILIVGAAPARAGTKTHKDEVRGFECRVEDSFEQVPPKPGDDDIHIAAEWQDPSPKYQRFTGDQPTFRIIWTVQPKGDVPAEDRPLPPWAKDLPPEVQEQIRTMSKGTKETLSSEVNRMLEWNERLFGPYKSLEDRLAEQREKDIDHVSTADDLDVRVLEINYHKKRPKDSEPHWWMWVGMTEWETPTEKIELGFYGYVDVKFAKDFRKQFEKTVRSFKRREIEEDEDIVGDSDAVLPTDPPNVAEKLAKFVKEKVIKGWSYKRTPHYLVVFDDDVDRKRIVRRVVEEIEALREDVYEVMFPPDRPVTAVSIVRICETRDQYMAYGAPGGSAGYWSPYHEELVLYQDKNDKKDAIRVLYHEAFHQYIFYSVGEISPHSWFNEGHGDFFSGHVYKSRRFHPDVFSWRTGTAQEAKRRWKEGWKRVRRPRAERATQDGEKPAAADTSDWTPENLSLREWLTWRQPQYYGSNDWEIPGGVNYALGWSFIYFLRETRNEAYQQILPKYFNALKSFVTQDRDAREAGLQDGFGIGGEGPKEPGEPGEPGDGEKPVEPGDGEATPTEPVPEGGTTDRITRSEWHGESLKEAMGGIDLDQLEKDWLDHSW